MIRFPTPPSNRCANIAADDDGRRLIVRFELDATEIEVLVARGYLSPREKDNLGAIKEAANDFISDALVTS